MGWKQTETLFYSRGFRYLISWRGDALRQACVAILLSQWRSMLNSRQQFKKKEKKKKERLCFAAPKMLIKGGMFSSKLSRASLLWANERSGLFSESVGTTAGHHNLSPLSNHTNYTPLYLVVSEWLRFFFLFFFFFGYVCQCLLAARVHLDT